jgi:hypothetical protein
MNRPVDGYRFTGNDETRVTDAVRRACARWRTLGIDPSQRADDLRSLEMIAWHALGCTGHDLRDSERAWITEEVRRVAGVTP